MCNPVLSSNFLYSCSGFLFFKSLTLRIPIEVSFLDISLPTPGIDSSVSGRTAMVFLSLIRLPNVTVEAVRGHKSFEFLNCPP